MPQIPFGYGLLPSDTEFSVIEDDFSSLEIRPGPEGSPLHYFYDAVRHRLITDFVLDAKPQVATLVQVTLIKKGEQFSPRLRFWKKNKTKAASSKQPAQDEVSVTPITKVVKALVDTSDCHDAFWRLVRFLQSLSDVEVPSGTYRVLETSTASLVQALDDYPREDVLSALKAAFGSGLTDEDVALLTNRREQLELFGKLLEDDEYFDQHKAGHGFSGDEAVWQSFFESNQWIFGYGLNLIATQSVSASKLEQITSGASIFSGAGKRSDGLLRTRGYISSLLFVEIKTHRKNLLKASAYRAPDVYQVSDEVSGGLSQLQKTAEKAVRGIVSSFHAFYAADGSPTGVEVSVVRPRMSLIVGRLSEFSSAEGINYEKFESFDLYRRGIKDVDIITFDELYSRARFIVAGQ